MSFPRSTTLIGLTLATALLLASTVRAGQVSMADGSVTFHTPAGWLTILETQGDPEAKVFQVPDPSPTGKSSLARITVTVKQVPDISSFNQFMAEAAGKALELPGYKAAAAAPSPNSDVYTANEIGTRFNYVEHYWLKNGHAIQLRCVRPSKSLAGAGWETDFDKGCAALAEQLK